MFEERSKLTSKQKPPQQPRPPGGWAMPVRFAELFEAAVVPFADRYGGHGRRLILETAFSALERVAPALKAEADPDSWPNWQGALVEILEAAGRAEAWLLAQARTVTLLLAVAVAYPRLWLRELRQRALRGRLPTTAFSEAHSLATVVLLRLAIPRGPPSLLAGLSIAPRAP